MIKLLEDALFIALTLAMGLIVMSIIWAVIPNIPLPTQITTAVQWLTQALVNVDFVIPVSTIYTILKWGITIEVIGLSVGIIRFLHENIIKPIRKS